jgi:uncharacterized protein (TIGR00661 family)
MKILYGIQCTGNGHLSRSREIIRNLSARDEVERVDVCLSGTLSQIDTNDLNVRYKFDGLTLKMEGGEMSLWGTVRGLRLGSLLSSALSVNVHDYDGIVSDFEPVSCWAGLLRGKRVFGVSNQYKFLSNKRFIRNLSPNFLSNKFVTRMVCPVSEYIAFDYLKELDNDFFPIIREPLRRVKLTKEDFYLVYLNFIPLEEQIKFFNLFPSQTFYVFHSEVREASDFENIRLRPIDRNMFTEKMIRCQGVICHTGFQTTSECLYLGKKLLVMPLKNQIEQIYNTKVLKKLGVISASFLDVALFDDFFQNDYSVKLNYVDEMDNICNKITEFVDGKKGRRGSRHI